MVGGFLWWFFQDQSQHSKCVKVLGVVCKSWNINLFLTSNKYVILVTGYSTRSGAKFFLVHYLSESKDLSSWPVSAQKYN